MKASHSPQNVWLMKWFWLSQKCHLRTFCDMSQNQALAHPILTAL
jgi:hypothetical protein